MADGKPDLRAVFFEALNMKSSEELAQYLDTACGGDTGFRAQVEELLASHQKAGNFLGGPLPSHNVTVDMPEIAEGAGASIGPYKLLEQIGEGGFGIVYMADQQAPVRRRVALKIIKPGMDTRQVLARFKAELQALSLMDHPNIARALDAGATESGRPYFVMELVRGVPITEYCDQNNLPVHERLDLFVHVCHAVQHAHQKGIIHRDIKPSNVLVTLNDGRALPKVIDFGVAKAINQQLTPETIFTRFAEMIGTPLYMSPEQAEMSSLDIDTRADIYSLGVLLYELLTGSTPFDKDRLRKAAFDEIRRIIREEEPPKPSLRISTLGDTRTAVAAHRHVDPHHLGVLVRGDLDWIVMKALEKDRTRRYETCDGLAMELQRYLADEPVQACPPSATYKFRKFARRNRAALAMAAILTAALLLGIVGTTWQAILATHARDRAVTAEGLAQTRFEAESRARSAEANQRAQAEANYQKARAAVDEYFTLVSESKLLDVPGLQPLRKELLEAALRFYEKFAVERTNDPGALADVAVTHLRVAEVCLTLNRTDDGVASLAKAQEVVDRLRRDYPAANEHHRRLAGYWKGFRPASAPTAPRDGPAAVRTLERLAGTWQQLAGENPSEIGFQSDLAAIYAHLGQLLGSDQFDQSAIFVEKAEHILETLVRQYPRISEYRADLARVDAALIGTFGRLGRSADSYSALRRSLQLNEQLAADFPGVPQYRVDLTLNLLSVARRGDTKQPVAVLRRAIDQAKGLVTEFRAAPLYRRLLTSAANDLLTLVRLPGEHQQEAEKLYRELMADLTQLTAENPEHPDQYWQNATAYNYIALANVFEKEGRSQESEKAIQQAISILTKLVTAHPNDRISRNMLAESYQILGTANSGERQFENARKAYRQAADLATQLTVDFPGVSEYRARLAHSLRQFAFAIPNTGQTAEKEQALREAVRAFEQLAIDFPKQPLHRFLLADIHRAQGQLFADRGHIDESTSAYRLSNGIYQTLAAEYPKNLEYQLELTRCHNQLAAFLKSAGRFAEAEQEYREALALTSAVHPQQVRWRRQELMRTHGNLGRLFMERDRPAESEQAFRASIVLAEQLNTEYPNQGYTGWLTTESMNLVALLGTTGRAKEADETICKILERKPANAAVLNQVAWFLSTCPEQKLRDPKRAVDLAQKAVELAPKERAIRNTLGVAHFRAGNWKAATLALEKSMELGSGGDASDWFFLAMAHWHSGDKAAARIRYDQAVAWMGKNPPKDDELKRFWAEAEALLKSNQAVKPDAPKH